MLYLSALCDNAHQGKKLLNAAINSLFTCPDPVTRENSSVDRIENTELKPTLLWSALYIQELTTVCFLTFIGSDFPWNVLIMIYVYVCLKCLCVCWVA